MGYVFLIPGFVFLGCFLVFPFFNEPGQELYGLECIQSGF